MEKIKQNKKYLVIIPIFTIIISILSIPVFADNNQFLAIPIVANATKPDLISGGIDVGIDTVSNASTYYATTIFDIDIYCFTANGRAYAIWKGNQISSGSIIISCFDATSSGVYSISGPGVYDSTYDCYTATNNSSRLFADLGDVIPNYSTVNDAIIAFSTFDPNAPSTTPHNISFSLPFGNVAYVDLGETSTQYGISRHYTGTAYFPELSNLFNNMFGDDYGTWGYASSLPSSSTQLVAPTTKFEFVKTGSTNLLGQSHNGAWSQTSTASSRYLVLYNPLNLAGGQGDFITYNFSIPDAYDVKVFPLNTVFNLSNGISCYQETIGDPITGTVDETTGEIVWTDSNGDTSTGPTIGGQNAINNESTSVVDWLKKIANDIVTFLNRSLESVNVLISGGSAFISKIGALYSWLPSPVYSVIISAITLVFAIGVIKVFL